MVLPESTVDHAKIWAERTRAAVAAQPVLGPANESIPVTASFDLAVLQRSAPTPEAMITRAATRSTTRNRPAATSSSPPERARRT